MSQINSIFVYGTLQLGKQNQNILKKLNGVWKKGYIFGKLLNISHGPDYGYPGLKIDKKGKKIYGMIFQSKNLEKNIKKIDKFEGAEYKRVISKVYLINGFKLKAYVYELKKSND